MGDGVPAAAVVPGRSPFRRTDVRAASLLGAVATLVTLWTFYRGLVPQEDAAILFRYSENVANGFGIVYNPGGERVDGATDMPFMWGIAALIRLGLGTTLSATLLNAVAVGVLVAVVYLAWTRWARTGPWWSLLPVVALAVGPAWAYGMAGFGTVVFAALAAVTAVAAERAARHPTNSRLLVTGAAVVLLGLARPEGFLLGAFVVAAQAWRIRSMRMLLAPAAVVVPLGLAWIAWRWSYFGYPLPNPFYKKGGGSLYSTGLSTSIRYVASLGAMFLVPVITALFVADARRRAVSILGVVVGWTLVWALLSDEMNFYGRFQYAVVAVLAVMTATLVPGLRAAVVVERRRTTRLIAGAAAGAVLVMFAFSTLTVAKPSLGRLMADKSELSRGIHQNLADTLAPFAVGADSRRLATTEAGYVAWKAGWQVTDLWGLNDKSIAHEGFLSPDDLRDLAPDVVFAHLCYPTGLPTPDSDYPCISGWNEMADPLVCFLDQDRYALAGYWVESPSHAWAVWVDESAEDSESLSDAIADMDSGQSRLGTERVNQAHDANIPVPESCPQAGT